MDTDQQPCFQNNHPGRFIANWKYPITWADIFGFDVIFKPIRYLLRNEDHFVFATAFWFPQQYFSFVDVIGHDAQDLADPHRAPRHQFQHYAVSDIAGSEYNFIHRFLIQDVELRFDLYAKQLAQHGRITWVVEIRIYIVFGKIEKGR